MCCPYSARRSHRHQAESSCIFLPGWIRDKEEQGYYDVNLRARRQRLQQIRAVRGPSNYFRAPRSSGRVRLELAEGLDLSLIHI